MAKSALPVRYRRTLHIEIRQRQRGICDDAIRTALDFGRCFQRGNGARAYYLGDREIAQVQRRDPTLARRIRRHRRTTVIVANDTSILITAYRCDHPSFLRRGRR